MTGEPLTITLHDVDSDFQSETPFTTGQIIQIPKRSTRRFQRTRPL